jgi:hypothetical protein
MAARNLILNNFWWKLLSLILAALTWLTIQTILRKDRMESAQSPVVTTHARNFNHVPITLMTPASNTNLFRINPLTVSVEVTGNVDDLSQLLEKDITAYVDTSTFDGRLPLDVHVQVPPQFKVANVKPRWAGVDRLPPDQPNSQPPGHLP